MYRGTSTSFLLCHAIDCDAQLWVDLRDQLAVGSQLELPLVVPPELHSNHPVVQEHEWCEVRFVQHLVNDKQIGFGMDLSRNRAAPLTAYYAQKENDYGNETHIRI